MKELSIEEKARAYDKALEKAKKNYDVAQELCNGSRIGVECFKNTLINIFPELKEDNDNQSKNWILEYLYDGLRRTDEQFKDEFKAAIAWLKKQGNESN